MASKELLRSLSEVLFHDERVLSARERELLTRLAQNAREFSASNNAASVAEVIERTVGETILQRAAGLIGKHIVYEMLNDPAAIQNLSVPITFSGPRPPQPGPGGPGILYSGPRPPQPGPGPGALYSGPRPPQPGPGGPASVHSGPRPPQPGPGGPGVVYSGPRPPQPGPGGPGTTDTPSHSATVAVCDGREFLPARFAVLDEFLMPEELAQLTSFALEHEPEFIISEVVSPREGMSAIDYEHRRSRVLMNIGKFDELIANRVRACLPQVLQRLGRGMFEITRVEAQITASNDGDFFRHHSDNGQGEIATRELTFVYFFHREPKAFAGGNLRIYDTHFANGEYVSSGEYKTVVPEQNQIVFFASSLLHEITQVECPSRAFADSRFTLNGWFHR